MASMRMTDLIEKIEEMRLSLQVINGKFDAFDIKIEAFRQLDDYKFDTLNKQIESAESSIRIMEDHQRVLENNCMAVHNLPLPQFLENNTQKGNERRGNDRRNSDYYEHIDSWFGKKLLSVTSHIIFTAIGISVGLLIKMIFDK